MPEIHGNTEGIRKTVLDELAMLYDVQLEPGQFMPQDLLQSLCGYSASMNREIAVYITRFGEVADVLIGRVESFALTETRTAYEVEIRLAADISALADVILVHNEDLEEVRKLESNVQRRYRR